MREFPKAQASNGTQRDVFTVQKLNRTARTLLEDSFPQIWVEGEISNLSTPRSGHLYFTLKDDSAQIRCAWFRNRRSPIDYSPADGDSVLVRARLTVYEARGDFQLVVQYMEPAGEGALRLRFERLKQKLQAEGLFDPGRKRELPSVPARVGVITSPGGAAVRDIITTCARRFPAVPLVIYPTPVQGDQAADGVVSALQLAQRRSECDVLILARGGGSLEDLWVFNEESVARALAKCSIPVVTGIGHETDYTIADFVADHRAPTPTASAEITVPDAMQLLRQLDTVQSHLLMAVRRKIERETQRNDLYAHRLLHPTRRYIQARHRFELLFGRLDTAMRRSLTARSLELATRAQSLIRHGPRDRLQKAAWRLHGSGLRFSALAKQITNPARQRLVVSTSRLNTVSPLATLDRGYALVTDATGRVVTSSTQLKTEDSIDVRLARGEIACRVDEIKQ